MPHPFSIAYLDQQIARTGGALPPAGAFDATPAELCCAGFDFCTLYASYTRGAAGGAVTIRPEFSEDSAGAVWHTKGLYAPAIVVPGADATSAEQRETITYASTAAGAELFPLGTIYLNGTVERIRFPAAESGVVGAPGTLALEARFSCRESHAI